MKSVEFFIEYFKDKIIFIIVNILVIIFSALLLLSLGAEVYPIIFISMLYFITSILFYIFDFGRKCSFYKKIYSNLEEIDKKYLVTETVKEPSFFEGKLIYDVISKCNKDMTDNVAELSHSIDEYKEYIELWVHEVKTPIASCKLLIENNETEISQSIDEEIVKVESYIEQALFYTRSNAIEKDYIIRKIDLKEIINNVIRRNANVLISNRVKIEMNNINKIIYSDNKWIEFIIQQIIANSIKYMDKEEKILRFSSEEINNNVILKILDNGIGMNERDVIKSFDKGYTGDNGRKYGKSTGIGLYLCKKLCNKLGLSIKLKSQINNGTEVSILFPINDFMLTQ